MKEKRDTFNEIIHRFPDPRAKINEMIHRFKDPSDGEAKTFTNEMNDGGTMHSDQAIG